MSGQTADHEAESHGEGYLVSVSDLMVGLLFVFIMILVAFALLLRQTESSDSAELSEKLSRLSGQLEARDRQFSDDAEIIAAQREALRGAETERDLANHEAARAKEALERAKAALKALQPPLSSPGTTSDEVNEGLRACQEQRAGLLRDIQSRLRQRKVEEASIDVSIGVLRLSERALSFDSRADSLPPTGVQRDVVRAVADTFADTLPCFTASGRQARDCALTTQAIIDAVFVEGHTDRRRFLVDGKDDNYGLSARRALNVYELMRRDQPALWDLRNRETFAIMGMSGYGPERPVPGRTADTPDDYAANRRIEFRFLLDPLPCSRREISSRGAAP